MIVSCPACHASFRLDTSRIVGDWTPLACPRCATRFTVAVGDHAAIALVGMEEGDIRDWIARTLREAGFAVKLVETEAAAAHYLALCPPDVVVRGIAGMPASEAFTIAVGPECDLDTTQPRTEFEAAFADRLSEFQRRREQVADHEREVRRAERLARTILSDIILYNPEEVEKGIADGTFHELLAEDLADARAYFAEQVHPDVLREVNHFETYLEAYLAEARRKHDTAKADR